MFEIALPPVSHCVISDDELAGRRLFIVGDIHGCLDEFQTLLSEASVTADNTLVVCCGDLVNKGPKSRETVAFLRSLGSDAVRSVRGNHDELVVYARNKFDASPAAEQENVTYASVKDFQPEDIEFLFNQPYTISVPSYNVIVVHAGLVPGVSLDSQRPIDMSTMRGVILGSDGSYSGTPSKAVGPWAASWPGPRHVYFGHNASRGLQRHPFATGLDTGCVFGRELTGAMVTSPSQQPVLYSVPAKQVYAASKKGRPLHGSMDAASILEKMAEQKS